LVINGFFEVVPPSGLPAGSELPAMTAFNVVGIPLQPGSSYTWRVFLTGDDRPLATKTFAIAPVAPAPNPAH
jgi:hypothetical protein